MTIHKKYSREQGNTQPHSQKLPSAVDGKITLDVRQSRDTHIRQLRDSTGWLWSQRELAHFYSPPHILSPKHKTWLQEFSERLFNIEQGSFDSASKLDAVDIRSGIDDGVCRLRELARILAVLYPAKSQNKAALKLKKGSDRVLMRLGVYRELTREFGVQGVFSGRRELLLPPELRQGLIRTFETHSQTTCLEAKPHCEVCELSRFCSFKRRELRASSESRGSPTCVDLFCGAGGMSLGFRRAGFRTICATDFDADASRTYSLNNPDLDDDSIVCGDITDSGTIEQIMRTVGKVEVDILIGGPPCQGFSSSGNRSKKSYRSRKMKSGLFEEDDKRNYLFEYMVEVAGRLSPKVIIMENVPGMDDPRGDLPSFMEIAKRMLQDLGYTASIWKLDAAAFGVPQNRQRKFLVATKANLAPPMPEPEYESKIRDLNLADDLLPPVSIEQAISDLPALGVDDGKEVQKALFRFDDEAPISRHFLSQKQFPIRTGSKLIYNHRSRYNNPHDIELFGTLLQGENALDLLQKHGREDLMRYRKDVFHDKYFRLTAKKPSRTIVAHLSKDGNSFIHPTEVRTLTPRECARLQSFPDDYVFCGAASSQWKQIGNAVPPLLAFSLANALYEHIEREFKDE